MLKKLKQPKRSLDSLTRASLLVAPLLAGLATTAGAADGGSTNAAPPLFSLTKPAWLTELSVGVKESYDDNLFLAGANPVDYKSANLSKVPSSIAIAVRNRAAFATTVSPKIGVNFAPLLGDQHVLQVLALGYAPDFVKYSEHNGEDYNAHRMTAAVKAHTDSFTLSAENSVNLVDGSKFSPLYPGGLDSAIAVSAVRERRDQIQDRSAISLQYDKDKFFVRPTASLLYFDYQTEELAKSQVGGQTGYQNFSDRYDVNGGLDLGYKVMPKLAATVGYRYGAQYQETFAKTIDPVGYSSSSDYQRVLFGVEGKPLSWLDAKIQFGPDFRSYGPHAPVLDRNMVTYYGEAALTATVTPKDSVTFSYKQFQWVSGVGKTPYFESLFDLNYKRKLTDQLSLDLGARLIESDYTSGLDVTKLPAANVTNSRDDTMTTLSAGLTYTFNPHASITLAYSCDLGRNVGDNVPNPDSRGFNRNLVSLGGRLKF